jgi:hypothetical protein
MNPRELLARLNVPAVRYEIGRGGIPELTNIDIAGALGMIQDQFARDILCVVWWPDGSHAVFDSMAETVRVRLLNEYSDRERAHVAARLELNIAQSSFDAKPKKGDWDDQIVADLKREIDRASARRWPWSLERYSRMFPVVVEEMRRPRHCPACCGRGIYIDESGIKNCRRCNASGVRHETKSWRAGQFGLSRDKFARHWAGVYDWVYRVIADAENKAAKELFQIVRRDIFDPLEVA